MKNNNYIDNETIAQLAKQLAWYKSFFDNAADAMLIVQPETWSVLDSNECAGNLIGVPCDELIGMPLPQFRRIFKLLMKSNSPNVLSELTLETAAGEELMVEVSARFVEYNGQRLIQAIARDVSERRALTDKLIQADKLVLLGQLSAGVAHEIRNPLAAINLNLQLLQRTLPQDSPDALQVRTALQGVERIARIVDSTLNFSRPANPVVEPENLNALVLNSLELVSATLRR
ncbi:MAG TPA: histidine kinase dimerization/phospho-acceptor domain-containing protein, partial [Patescibacteria group bacterium]|nr:histidine kinase dimerization/phospho-acceptor domain-containing protein [Patescibacteria group bacterium]